MQGGERLDEQAIARLIHLCQPERPAFHSALLTTEQTLNALWAELVPLMGRQGAKAILARAVQIAQRVHPLAGCVRIGDDGLAFDQLRAHANQAEEAALDATLVALARATAEVIMDLMGSGMLHALLGDVELGLQRRAVSRSDGEPDMQA